MMPWRTTCRMWRPATAMTAMQRCGTKAHSMQSTPVLLLRAETLHSMLQAARELWQRMQRLGEAKIGDGPLVDDYLHGGCHANCNVPL